MGGLSSHFCSLTPKAQRMIARRWSGAVLPRKSSHSDDADGRSCSRSTPDCAPAADRVGFDYIMRWTLPMIGSKRVGSSSA